MDPDGLLLMDTGLRGALGLGEGHLVQEVPRQDLADQVDLLFGDLMEM